MICRIALLSSVLLSGCASVFVAPIEPAFNPAPQVQDVRVRLIQVNDPSSACKAAFPQSLSQYWIVLACAGWSEDRKECTIITGKNPPTQVLGHELRHCFEANFH
jgi:hypothetical protein